MTVYEKNVLITLNFNIDSGSTILNCLGIVVLTVIIMFTIIILLNWMVAAVHYNEKLVAECSFHANFDI